MIFQGDKLRKLNLYKIRDMCNKSGRSVFTTSQLANLLGVSDEIARLYSSRLVKNGMAQRIRRGYISFSRNDYIIATQLLEPSYISLNSALLFHGIIQQVPNNVQVVTTINSLNLSSEGIEYHKIDPGLFFGYDRVRTENSYFLMASPEKAMIDGFYLNIFDEEFLIDHSKGLEYSKIMERLLLFRGIKSKKIKGGVGIIDAEAIRSLAKRREFRPWQEEKRYIQSVILTGLADSHIVFKGGTYLWLFHDLQRFSEDLDFTSTGEIGENLPDEISKLLFLYGIENEVSIMKNNAVSTSFRILAKGPLNMGPKDLCSVYVEIGKRELVKLIPIPCRLDIPE